MPRREVRVGRFRGVAYPVEEQLRMDGPSKSDLLGDAAESRTRVDAWNRKDDQPIWTFTFTIQVTDGAGDSATGPFSLTVG